MLNTSIWTTAIGSSQSLVMPDLVEDFDAVDRLPTVRAVWLYESVAPEKPYVYGRHKTDALRLESEWNQNHPFDPMPY